MVRMIENWTKVDGVITGLKLGNSPEGLDEITMQVSNTENYLHYPNMVDKANSTALQIKLAHSKVAELGLQSGEAITALVRAAGNQQYFFAEGSINKI